MVNAHRINQGLTPELTGDPASNFHFAACADPEDGVAKVLRLVTERIPARFGLDPVRDVQVLCPMNRGALGARALNLELQRALNPPGEMRVERFGWTSAVGDKMMPVENDDEREVYNGDLGFIVRIDPRQAAGGGRRPAQGAGARGQGRAGAAAVVEAREVAGRRKGTGLGISKGDGRVSCAVIRGDDCPTRSPDGR